MAYEIALTGGPCAGKTTAKNYLAEKLPEYGVRLFFVPEAATMLIDPGIPDLRALKDQRVFLEFEKTIVAIQQSLRAHYRQLATQFAEPVLILNDRGECDAAAYVSQKQFGAILKELGLSLAEVRDSYDAVIHLETAASGAEEFYSNAGNAARQESLSEAREADARTKQAWLGQPHLKVIENKDDGFEGKMHRTLQAITRVMGLPVPLEIERKFLLSESPPANWLKRAQAIEIEQVYLRSADDQEVRVRCRRQGDAATYYKTHKRRVASGVRHETEARISAAEYRIDLANRDPKRRTIRKTRYCFLWENQYFELDHVTEPRELWLLEIELTDRNDSVRLPSELSISSEVTDDSRYSNAQIAQEP